VHELPRELLKKEDGTWALTPTYWVHSSQPKTRPSLAVYLDHRHYKKGKVSWKHCGLTNPEEVKRGADALYECSSCGEEAPIYVVNAKVESQLKHEGYDPLNDRKAAIQATKEKRNK